MFGIALPIIVIFLVAQVLFAMFRHRSLAGVGMAVVQAGIAVLGTAASLPLVSLLTVASDRLADGMMALTFGEFDQMGAEVSASLSQWMTSGEGFTSTAFAVALMPAFGASGALIAGLVLGLLIAFGSFMVWAALLIRSMLLTVVVVIGPIAIMGSAFEPTKRWTSRWVSMVTALIFTKLGVVVVFGLGVSMLSSLSVEKGSAGAALGQLFTAALLLMLAAFVPVACFRFFDFLGESAVSGSHGAVAAAAPAAVGAVSGAGGGVKSIIDRLGSLYGGGGGAGGATDSTAGGGDSGPKVDQVLSGDTGADAGSVMAGTPTAAGEAAGASTGAAGGSAAAGASSEAAGGTAAAGAATGGAAVAAVIAADQVKGAGSALVKATNDGVEGLGR